MLAKTIPIHQSQPFSIRWSVVRILPQVASQAKKQTLDNTLEAQITFDGNDEGTS